MRTRHLGKAALAGLLTLATQAGASTPGIAPCPPGVPPPPGCARPSASKLLHIAAPAPPLSHAGRWITDRRGRVAILHGVNMVYKRPPYHAGATGFGVDDAKFLRRNGFNTVRLGMIYAGVEPQPGVYDVAYIRKVRSIEKVLAKRGIFSQIDFHQDLYNEKFGGEGWPDWAVLDENVPAEPLTGFPGSYVSSPGLNRAFDNWWENEAGPGGIGIQDRYAAAWRRVALAFRKRPYVMGYDLLNEPWPGSPWPSCANNEGCPGFDAVLTAFSNRMIAAIRQVDRRNLIWYEPNVIFNFGSKTHHGDTGDPRAGMSFHVYCLSGALGGGSGTSCPTFEELTFENADAHSEKTGDALLLSEFGATNEPDTIERIVEFAEEAMVSWQYWHYCECDDPTTQGPGVQSVVPDPSKPPRGKNLRKEKLALLSVPHPQTVAGTPTEISFDPQTKRFELIFSKKRASGKGSFPRGLSDVFIPRLHYPRGYRVKVKGAQALRRGGQHLILRNRGKAKAVKVTVTKR